MPVNEIVRYRIETPVRHSAMQQAWIANQAARAAKGPIPTAVQVDAAALPPGASVLLCRRAGLGDVLMVTPLARKLAGRGISVSVETAGENVCLFDGNPHVAAARATGDYGEWERCGFAGIVDLESALDVEFGEHKHPERAFAAACGLTLADDDMHLDYFPETGEIEPARALLASLPRPWVAYAWAAKGRARNWSAQSHQEALTRLSEAGAGVVILSARPADVPVLPNVLNLSGKVGGLRTVGGIIAACDGMVTPDTGLFHLGAALAKPILAYFGPFPLEERATHGSLTLVNETSLETCRFAPCRSFHCPWEKGLRMSPCLAPDLERIDDWVRFLMTDQEDPTEAPPAEADDPADEGEAEAAGEPAAPKRKAKRRAG